MRAHAAADDGDGHPEDRPADARPAQNGSGLPGHRPDADAADDAGRCFPKTVRRTSAAAPAQPVNPLQRLIAGRLQERGWSYGEVARRSGLPRSTVYTLATTRNLVRPPRPATIDGLAKGLDVPVSAVRAAAAESTGMHYYDEPPADPRRGVPGDQERELLIASIDELSAEDRRHVAALVESLRNRPAPPPTASAARPATPPGPRPRIGAISSTCRTLCPGAAPPARVPAAPSVPGTGVFSSRRPSTASGSPRWRWGPCGTVPSRRPAVSAAHPVILWASGRGRRGGRRVPRSGPGPGRGGRRAGSPAGRRRAGAARRRCRPAGCG